MGIVRKILFTILITFAVILIAIVVRHKFLHFDISDLVGMTRNGFSEIYILSGDKKTPLNDREIIEVFRVISVMREQEFTGWRGEKWKKYCSINFKYEDESDIYRIDLSSRKSMKGDILARLQKISGSSTYYYQGYNGNTLTSILNEIPYNQLQHRTVNKIGQKDGRCY